VIDEAALISALQEGRIAAALYVTRVEPLAGDSALGAMRNIVITPHTAGETQRSEDGVIDLLLANLERPWRGEPNLVNQVV
jgi:phosphoglycerate dehydrogenase-like enzyme